MVPGLIYVIIKSDRFGSFRKDLFSIFTYFGAIAGLDALDFRAFEDRRATVMDGGTFLAVCVRVGNTC